MFITMCSRRDFRAFKMTLKGRGTCRTTRPHQHYYCNDAVAIFGPPALGCGHRWVRIL